MSVRNLPTLKGVFPEPKTQPKRDFLRENKLKLKTLQKANLRHIRECNGTNEENNFTGRHYLNSRRNETPSVLTKRLNSGCSCASKKPTVVGKSTMRQPNRLPRKLYSDKSIQTEDIADEVFLTNALQKCSLSNINNNNFDLKLPGSSHSSNFRGNNIRDEQNVDIPDSNLLRIENNDNDNENESENVDLPTELSHHKSTGCNLRDFDERSMQSRLNCEKNTKQSHVIKNNDALDSGTRKQIKIPKYLEREKREKELKRIRELARDPNCPIGHYVLSEEEKRAALTTAQDEFRKLVDELNRMPLTTETLRIRNRKVEIEKTLADLENTIRMLSKQKVYVKIND